MAQDHPSHIIRAVNRKTLHEFHENQSLSKRAQRDERRISTDCLSCWPASSAGFFLGVLFRNPRWLKEMNGTVSLTRWACSARERLGHSAQHTLKIRWEYSEMLF